MRRLTTTIAVEQQIIYAETGEIERFNHKTEGVLLELTSFTTMTYQDLDQQTVVVKWQDDQVDEGWSVEIKRQNNILRFNPHQMTSTVYTTSQGYWELTIETQRLEWQFEPGEQPRTIKKTLIIDYQLKKDDERLGNYQFRLIYTS